MIETSLYAKLDQNSLVFVHSWPVFTWFWELDEKVSNPSAAYTMYLISCCGHMMGWTRTVRLLKLTEQILQSVLFWRRWGFVASYRSLGRITSHLKNLYLGEAL